MNEDAKIEDILGKVIVSIENEDNRSLEFTTSDGEVYLMFDENSSYGNDSSAIIEDITGSLDDLLNNPILVAEKRKNNQAPKSKKENGEDDDWYTTCWTFYELATIKGSITLRWYCEASPHYATEVDFIRIA